MAEKTKTRSRESLTVKYMVSSSVSPYGSRVVEAKYALSPGKTGRRFVIATPCELERVHGPGERGLGKVHGPGECVLKHMYGHGE
jgi:hypothetical protein